MREAEMKVECFQVDATDNVATLLQDAEVGAEIRVLGGGAARDVQAAQAIRAGHKVALQAIAEDEAIVKYGFQIGEATRAIAEGDWVHLHNCRSRYDARSSDLDVDSGSRIETRYA
jgi:hypothetical protein